MATPAYQGAGSQSSGTGDVTPTWEPAAYTTDDVAFLFVQSSNQTIALSTDAGFTDIPELRQGTGTAAAAGSVGFAAYWCRATSGSMPAPTVTDPGDHVIARMAIFRGCAKTGLPYDSASIVATVLSTADTAVTVGGATTSMTDGLVVIIVVNGIDSAASQLSGQTNADLASLTERFDSNTSSGTGGGFCVTTGTKAVRGTFGATTATLAASSKQIRIAITLRPIQTVPLPGLGAPVVTGFAPLALTPKVTKPGLGAVTITGFAPTVLTPRVPKPGVGAVTITGFAPAVRVRQSAALCVIVLTAVIPVLLQPGTGELLVTGFAPVLPVTVKPDLGQVIITGFEPTVRQHKIARPGVGALSLNPIASLITPTDPTVVQLATQSGVSNDGTAFAGYGMGNAIAFPATATLDYAYLSYVFALGQIHTFSIFVEMADGSVPRPGNHGAGSANEDFSVVMSGNVAPSGWEVSRYFGKLYRVRVAFAPGTAPTNFVGIVRYTNQSAKAFKIAGYQLALGTAGIVGPPTILTPRTPQPSVGGVIVTGLAPRAVAPPVAQTGRGALEVVGEIPIILAPREVRPSRGQVTVDAFAPTIVPSQIPRPGLGQVIITGFVPAINLGGNKTVQPNLGSVVITGLSPVAKLSVNRFVQPGTGDVVITGFVPGTREPLTFTPGTGLLTVTGQRPRPFATEFASSVADIGGLVITGQRPTVTVEAVDICFYVGHSCIGKTIVPTTDVASNLLILLLYDSFQGDIGLELGDHTPDSPNAFGWNYDEEAIDPFLQPHIEIQADGAIVPLAGLGCDYANYVMPVQNLRCRLTMVFSGTSTGASYGIRGRRDITNAQTILARLDDSGRAFLVTVLSDGTTEVSAFIDISGFVAAGSHTLELDMQETVVTVMVDGEAVLAATTAILAGNYVSYQVTGGGDGTGGTSFAVLVPGIDTPYACVTEPAAMILDDSHCIHVAE